MKHQDRQNMRCGNLFFTCLYIDMYANILNIMNLYCRRGGSVLHHFLSQLKISVLLLATTSPLRLPCSGGGCRIFEMEGGGPT